MGHTHGFILSDKALTRVLGDPVAGGGVFDIMGIGEIEMNRERAVGRAMLAAVLGLSLAMSGCSSNWVDEAEQISTVLIPAVANMVTLVAELQGHGVSAQDLALIQNAGTQAGADLQLVQSLILAYQKADAAAQPGILNQVQSALKAAQGNLLGLLPALHIKDAATQAKITAVMGILISEVQSLSAVVPLLQNSATAKISPQGTQGSTGESQNPALLSAREFVKSYNSVLTAKSGNASLDSAARGLRIHIHGAVARWASGGVLE